MKSRKGTVQNAKQMYDFCEANLKISSEEPCQHKKRIFFYNETVQRNTDKCDLKTLKGTHHIHSVQGVKPGEVKARELSCFCEVCVGMQSDKSSCVNYKYVAGWVHHTIYKSEDDVGNKQKQNGKNRKKRETKK